jgi:glycosyltransferase involved in cell wall biosynthesis
VIFIPSLIRPIRPWRDIFALFSLYHHFRAIRPHIVHTHSSKAGILGRIAAYLAGVPVIIHTFHGFGFTPDQSPKLRALLIRIERFCARLCTHLIYVSGENRRQAEALRIGTGVPSSLIRSGISMARPVASTFRLQAGVDEQAWVVLCVGNFKPQKNPLDLAKVAVATLKEDSDLHFFFAGDGELRPQVEAWVRDQPHAERIHFLGWRQDVSNLLGGSNMFLLTSLWEGLPRAVVEAFAAGLPVVAYGVDGVREVIDEGKTGFLIPPGETALAAQQILWLKNHRSEAKAMGAAGHQRVEQEFDIDRMVVQQDELYQKVFQEVPLKEYYEKDWEPPAKLLA